MALLKNLLGNSNNDGEHAEQIRALLLEMQQERTRCETLLESTRASSERLQQLGDPMAKAGKEIDAMIARVAELEQRLETATRVASAYDALESRAQSLEQCHSQAESRIAETLAGTENMRSSMEDLGAKAELAASLKEQLVGFLDIEKPFQQLRGEADSLRGQVEGTSDHLARLREQHDRLLDAHKLAMSKMEALDRRRDDLGRSLTDKERRVATVEAAVRGMDGAQQTVESVRREMQTLKATADLITQKMGALEAQREVVDRALAQAEHLDQAMKQIDAGVRQQEENERALAALNEQIVGVRSLHDQVMERSTAISSLQSEIDERTQAARQELVAVSDETKKTIERFDFERRGMESVTQRVADLRAALSDCESRFKVLAEPSQAVGELKSRSESLGSHLQTLTTQVGHVNDELAKLEALRRDLDDTARNARQVGAQMAQIEDLRPAIEAALRDLEQLRASHAAVTDTLEHSQMTHAEIVRMREAQGDTRTWLDSVEQMVSELRGQASELRTMSPTIEFVQSQVRRIGEAMTAIESGRESVENLHRQMSDLGMLCGQLDERGHQLQSRMEAAEQRFVGLAAHAEDAERMTMTIASVNSGLNEAQHQADEVRKSVTSIASRCESVESLAERTRTMKQELDQRQKALAESAKELKKTSTLRQEAAASAQELEELSKKLTTALATADQRVTRVDELSGQLESRASSLRAVEKRMAEFEERLAQWDVVDQEVSRALDQIVARQDTVETLQADLDRMFAMAEKTATHVREITSSHLEVENSREMLASVMDQLRELRETADTLDERKRQMTKAEERLARAEGLLVDVRSSLESLQGQKAIVDQAVEKAGSLQFLLKQAEAAIEGLREERKTAELVRSAVAVGQDEEGDDEFGQAA
jgi:chromosome segregation ATPase